MLTASLITAGVTAAASIGGSVAANQQQKSAQRRMREALDAQARRDRQHYDAQYYDDGTQRADNVRALTIAQNRLRRQTQAEAGKAAVMGGTTAQSAAAKEAANAAYADAVSQVAANADAKKDAISEAAHQSDKAHAERMAQLQYNADQAHIQNIQSAVNGVGQAAGAVGAAFAAGDGGTTAAKAAQGATASPSAQQTAVNATTANSTPTFQAPTKSDLVKTMADNMTPDYLKFKPKNIWERGGYFGK